MLKRPHYIALGLVAMLTLIILNLPAHTAARLKLAVGSLFLPLFGLSSSSQQAVEKAGDTIVPRSELLKQIDTLRRENAQLKLQAIQAQEVVRENAQFRQLFNWRQNSQWKLSLAKVLVRDPANWWRSVQIDVGSSDKVQPNMTVLAPDGYLVGRVGPVSLTHSQVILLGDPNCQVSVVVEGGPDLGMLGLAGPFDGSLVTLRFNARNENLKPGQNVITSGVGGIYPRGITVGKIVDFRPMDYGTYTEARVKLAANLGALEEVWVFAP